MTFYEWPDEDPNNAIEAWNMGDPDAPPPGYTDSDIRWEAAYYKALDDELMQREYEDEYRDDNWEPWDAEAESAFDAYILGCDEAVPLGERPAWFFDDSVPF